MADTQRADREILKPLLDRYLAIATHPRQEARKRLWADHYAMRPVPVTPFSVYFEGMSGTAWRDCLGPAPLETAGAVARSIEGELRKCIWMDEHVDDDTPKWLSVILNCPTKEDTGWGVEIGYERPAERDGAHKPIPPFAAGIDVGRLRRRELLPDVEAGERIRAEAAELLDGRLAVHFRYPALSPSTFDTLVTLRGMDNLFLDVIDQPDALHAMSEIIADSVCADVRRREAHGWMNVWPEDAGRYCRGPHRIRAFYGGGSGVGVRGSEKKAASSPDINDAGTRGRGDAGILLSEVRGFSEPRTPNPIFRFADEWPYFSDQTSAGLGPAQFEEFVVRYHRQMAALLTRPTIYFHGCECLDRKFDAIMTIPNLKHVHVSPYTNLDGAIERLRADLIIEAHSHPGNVFFAFTDAELEADVRTRMGICARRPCGLFLSDIHSVNGRPERLGQWAAYCRRYAAK